MVLDQEYKASDMLRLAEFRELRQNPSEGIKAFSQRVQRCSYELGCTETMLINQFVFGLNGSHEFLMAVLTMQERFKTLAAITDATDALYK